MKLSHKGARLPRIMTSIGPKAPVSLPALPSQEVTPANPATEQHERDQRGREQQNPALDQDVSAEPQAQSQTPQPTLDHEAKIREHYAKIQQLSPQEMVGYISALRGAGHRRL